MTWGTLHRKRLFLSRSFECWDCFGVSGLDAPTSSMNLKEAFPEFAYLTSSLPPCFPFGCSTAANVSGKRMNPAPGCSYCWAALICYWSALFLRTRCWWMTFLRKRSACPRKKTLGRTFWILKSCAYAPHSNRRKQAFRISVWVHCWLQRIKIGFWRSPKSRTCGKPTFQRWGCSRHLQLTTALKFN